MGMRGAIRVLDLMAIFWRHLAFGLVISDIIFKSCFFMAWCWFVSGFDEVHEFHSFRSIPK
jgi:hypothetical protein